MVEGQIEDICGSKLSLYSPGEQVSHVLDTRCNHLGTDQGSALTPGIDADQTGVFSDNASATLIAIVDASDCDIALETRKTRAHNSELRISKDNGQRGSARLGLDRGPGSRVDPRDAAFIESLVQQRTIPVDVTGDEDRAISALHRLGIKTR